MIDKPSHSPARGRNPMNLIDYYEDKDWAKRYTVPQGRPKPAASGGVDRADKAQARLQK